MIGLDLAPRKSRVSHCRQWRSRMIDPAFFDAYVATRFVVWAPAGEIVLRIGERTRGLDELMTKHGALGCAFITACNPGSVKLPDAENQVRRTELVGMVRKSGYVYFEGLGVGQDAAWPPEASILILGISRESAKRLGTQFGQLAIVFAELDRSVELVFCANEDSEIQRAKRG